MAAYHWVHVTCRLTAKNWDHLQNPMLCNHVWATFTFLPEHYAPNVQRLWHLKTKILQLLKIIFGISLPVILISFFNRPVCSVIHSVVTSQDYGHDRNAILWV